MISLILLQVQSINHIHNIVVLLLLMLLFFLEYASPFTYLEIDWNTEGLPRGPNNSFVSPHFDFHFYLKPRSYLQQEVSCPQQSAPSTGRVSISFVMMIIRILSFDLW